MDVRQQFVVLQVPRNDIGSEAMARGGQVAGAAEEEQLVLGFLAKGGQQPAHAQLMLLGKFREATFGAFSIPCHFSHGRILLEEFGPDLFAGCLTARQTND
jgi:hypothetical protein